MPLLPPTAIVLAAGLGKRMKSDKPKVLHQLLEKPLLGHVLDSLKFAGVSDPIVVVGYQGDKVIEYVGDRARCAWQQPQLGTGHAVQVAMPMLEGFEGHVVVTCGDAPLISGDTFRLLVEYTRKTASSVVVLTTKLPDAGSYGRIKRSDSGDVTGIVEAKDASPEELKINEINTGTYCFAASALRESLSKLKNDNAQNEYYLTDTLAILISQGAKVSALCHDDPKEFLGINTPADLCTVEDIFCEKIRMSHMEKGVFIEVPITVRIGPEVEIGARTRIRPGVFLEGRTVIGEDCVIGPNVVCTDAIIPDGSKLSPGHLSGLAPADRDGHE